MGFLGGLKPISTATSTPPCWAIPMDVSRHGGQRRCERHRLLCAADGHHQRHEVRKPGRPFRLSPALATSRAAIVGAGRAARRAEPCDHQKAIFGFHRETKQMMLNSIHPGNTLDECWGRPALRWWSGDTPPTNRPPPRASTYPQETTRSGCTWAERGR